jgi:long-chain acyl-CoA synthetase
MDKVWHKSYPEGMPKEINLDRYKSLGDFFEKNCKKYHGKKAVTNMGATLTFEQLEEKTRHFASYLQNVLKLKKGDRLAIMLPNTIQYYIALFGALQAGVTVVNVNPLYTKNELVHQLRDARVENIIVLVNFAHTVEASMSELNLKNIIITELGDLLSFVKGKIVNFVVKYVKSLVPSYNLPEAIPFNTALELGKEQNFRPVEVNHNDIAFLQYTGGTTGVAKGAVLTHGNIIANVLQVGTWVDHTLEEGKEVTVLPLPMYHIFTLTCGAIFMIELGAESVLITNPRDLPHFIKELKGLDFTIFISINTLCKALLNKEGFDKLDFSHLKYTIVGGMAATQDVADKWQEVTGVHLLEGYGLTETSPVVTINSFHSTEFTGGIGFPMPETDVDIKNDNGESVPLGQVGELCVKGPQVMSEYWNQPEETQKVFTPDGWLKTGDMVQMDDRGLITLVDRKKDMIIVSGFNVYPNEVEAVLMRHPGILEAAVIGIPNDEKSGETVKAFIVKRDDNLTKEDVILHCKKQLTPYKVPHEIEFRQELPKTPIGKILRRALREIPVEEVEEEERLEKAA